MSPIMSGEQGISSSEKDGGLPFGRCDFLGLSLAAVTSQQLIDTVIHWAKARRRARVTYINAMCVNTAADDADHRRLLRRAELVYADGQAIVWAARWLGSPVPERVNAGDLFPEFLRRCRDEGLRLFLLGSPEGRAESAAQVFRAEAPGLEIVGTHHGYLSGESSREVLTQINASRADILVIGMGVPHQERWLDRWDAHIETPVAWCVGALFDYFAGAFPRAPAWMRRVGLEWLFRLCLEPRRLWRRYLLGNPRFLWRVLRRSRLSL